MAEEKFKKALDELEKLSDNNSPIIAWKIGEQIALLFKEYQSTYHDQLILEANVPILASNQR